MNNMVWPLLLFPGKKVKNMIKFTKIITIKNIKITKPTLLNPIIFMLKRKMFLKNMINRDQVKVNVLIVENLDILVKIAKKKTGKYKNKFNMLSIDDKNQEELFRILESNNSSDSLEDDFSSSSSDSCYQSADDSFDSPHIKIGCRNSCCNGLTKNEENESLIIQMISQIQNPELQKEYLDKFKKNLIKDETSKKLKSTIRFEETLERFNKKKSKELTVNDFQH